MREESSPVNEAASFGSRTPVDEAASFVESGPTAEEAMHETRRIPAWLVLPGILAILLVGILAGRMMRPPEVREGGPTAAPTSSPDENWQPSPRPQGETVSLTVDFGNGAQKRIEALAWSEGMTVLKALEQAAEFRPGIAFAYKDSGEMAFVTTIDGLANAGAGGGYWIYEVNGEKAAKSAGVQSLAPGDALLWRYAVPE
jgi:hypothetical protein